MTKRIMLRTAYWSFSSAQSQLAAFMKQVSATTIIIHYTDNGIAAWEWTGTLGPEIQYFRSQGFKVWIEIAKTTLNETANTPYSVQYVIDSFGSMLEGITIDPYWGSGTYTVSQMQTWLVAKEQQITAAGLLAGYYHGDGDAANYGNPATDVSATYLAGQGLIPMAWLMDDGSWKPTTFSLPRFWIDYDIIVNPYHSGQSYDQIFNKWYEGKVLPDGLKSNAGAESIVWAIWSQADYPNSDAINGMVAVASDWIGGAATTSATTPSTSSTTSITLSSTTLTAVTSTSTSQTSSTQVGVTTAGVVAPPSTNTTTSSQTTTSSSSTSTQSTSSSTSSSSTTISQTASSTTTQSSTTQTSSTTSSAAVSTVAATTGTNAPSVAQSAVTAVSATASPSSPPVSSQVTLTATLHGSWNGLTGVVVNKEISISAWGSSGKCTTGQDGTCQVALSTPSTAGSYTVTVQFTGDSNFQQSSTSIPLTVGSVSSYSIAATVNARTGTTVNVYVLQGGRAIASQKYTYTASAKTFTFTGLAAGTYTVVVQVNMMMQQSKTVTVPPSAQVTFTFQLH
jgi:hypothetical protein